MSQKFQLRKKYLILRKKKILRYRQKFFFTSIKINKIKNKQEAL